ncbi:globin family protein [Azospirillum halopraeferens]|uniref:globin family protein n=1 Tax=Azospirillum halopraeferens TaxID=34010 RepID=UPI00042825D3|nr:globin family protein [Azospirillum halopraeferens]
MTPEQIDAVQASFRQVAAVREDAAAQFYDRLFTLDPGLRPLFKGDMAEQQRKLMATLGLAVGSLKAPEALAGPLRELGARHRDYGVQDEHYATVAEALLWTLERNLGPAFTDDVRGAWVALYGMVAEGMRRT